MIMVAAFKEYVFDFADLKLLSIICVNCGTEVIVDVSNPALKLPEKCGPCKHNFDEDFKSAIEDFHSAYTTFSNKNIERSVSARIRVHSELKASE